MGCTHRKFKLLLLSALMELDKDILNVWQGSLSLQYAESRKGTEWKNANLSLLVSPTRHSQALTNLNPIFHWTKVVILYLLIKSNWANETFGCCLVYYCMLKLETGEKTNWSCVSMRVGHFMVGLAGKSQKLIRWLLPLLGSLSVSAILIWSASEGSSQIRQELFWN